MRIPTLLLKRVSSAQAECQLLETLSVSAPQLLAPVPMKQAYLPAQCSGEEPCHHRCRHLLSCNAFGSIQYFRPFLVTPSIFCDSVLVVDVAGICCAPFAGIARVCLEERRGSPSATVPASRQRLEAPRPLCRAPPRVAGLPDDLVLPLNHALLWLVRLCAEVRPESAIDP